jgi:hypothetical protein
MKTLLILCIVLVLTPCISAQVKMLDQCGPADVSVFVKGDTILVNCDTVYTMTNERYQGYELMRLTLLKNNNLLFSTISQMKSAYETRIEQQKTEYLTLKSLYDDLDVKSTGYIKIIDNNLKASMASIESANIKIDSTRALIKDTRDIIKSDIRKQFGGKLLWGVGGVVIGLGVTTAIFLLAGH